MRFALVFLLLAGCAAEPAPVPDPAPVTEPVVIAPSPTPVPSPDPVVVEPQKPVPTPEAVKPPEPSKGEALLREAVKSLESGGEPRTILDKALVEFASEPERLGTLLGRGEVHLRLAQIAGRRGEEPEAEFKLALAEFEKAVKLDPTSAAALSGRGDVRTSAAYERRLRGEDVRNGDLDPAIADYTKAIGLDPKHAATWAGRGLARQTLALLRFQMARVFDPLYASSIKDIEEAIKLEPDRAYWHFQLGEARYLLAVHLGYRNEKNQATYQQAADEYHRAEKLDAASAVLYRDHMKISEINATETVTGDAKPLRHIAWARSWDLAKLEAKARNVPICIYISGGAG